MRALAPPQTVATRALRDHLQACEIDPSDDAAYIDWQASVKVTIDQFLDDPSGAAETDCDEFVSSCGRVFGIDDDAVPKLLQHFSSMSEESRLGVMLAIEESPSFAFLSRQIDCAPEDTPFENPTRSLRELLRATIAEL